MSSVTVMPRDHAWTVADLAHLPDDGLRYELLDGTLLVSAAPNKAHQRAIGRLYLLLSAACPADLEVFLAPTDYQPTNTRSFQPDLLVVSRTDPGDAAVTTPLALAVEVLSPSSRSVDLVLKRAVYEQAGVSTYWVVDPLDQTVTVWTLVDGAYGEPTVLSEPTTLEQPFRVQVDPTAL